MSERDIAAEIAEILSVNVDDVLNEVESEAVNPGSHVQRAWLNTHPNSDMEIEDFYSHTTSYIFDLMVESAREVRQEWRAAVVEVLNLCWGGAEFARVLDYGAGVGTDTLYFAEMCREAFYYDLPGRTSEFAVKRFAQRGVPISRVTNTEMYGPEFDAIVCFEVLEHLVDPLAHLDELVRLTKPGGMLFLTESFGLINENYPSHLARHKHLSGKLDELMLARGCHPQPVLGGRINVYVKGPNLSVIVPIYNAYDHVCRLLDSIRETTAGYPVTWMLVNDASPDQRILPLLNEFAASYGTACHVVNRVENGGFIQTCNDAMIAVGTNDVILLNSDTLLYDGWARRLLEGAYNDSQIGTATPLSNNVSCYSMFHHVNPINQLNATLAEAEQPDIDIPVGVGFCLYIKREVLDRVGMFDPVFKRGYGEETDLCLRAKAAGYRHVLVTGAFVYHSGSASMIAADVVRKGERTIEEHERVISRRYPDFVPSVRAFIASGVVETLGHDLNRRYIARESVRRPSIAIIVHDDVFGSFVGGTTYHIRDLIRDLEQDFVFYIVTPEASKVRVTAFVDGIMSMLIPSTDDYAHLLAELNPSVLHIHHLMGFPPSFIDAVIQSQVQKIYTIHDYYGVCPQYNLINYRQVYCGVPARNECDHCAKKLFSTGYSAVAAQRYKFQRLIDSVVTVIAPSRAALDEFRKAIIVPEEKVRVIPHPMVTNRYDPIYVHLFDSRSDAASGTLNETETSSKPEDTAAADIVTISGKKAGPRFKLATGEKADGVANIPPKSTKARLRVGFIGYNAPHKGTTLIQGIVAACSNNPIMFIAIGDIGKSAEDRKNLITTGQFRREEATELIKQHRVDVVVIASSWPETYCYTLSEAWMSGVPVIVGPLGAPAERVAETGAGLVMSDYRVESFVAALRKLMKDPAQLAQLKQAAATVSMPCDYREYGQLYRQHIHRSPAPSPLFSTYIDLAIQSNETSLNEVPMIAKLVEMRKRAFPVGTARERAYFWLHNRVSRKYAGGIIRK